MAKTKKKTGKKTTKVGKTTKKKAGKKATKKTAKKATRKTAKKATKKTAKKATKKTAKKATRKTAKKATKKAAKKTAKKKRVEAVPKDYGTVTPHLTVSPCKDAIEFYVKAFGAKKKGVLEGSNGTIMHAALKIGDSIMMLADEFPPSGDGSHGVEQKTPKNAGAVTSSLLLYVKDVDRAFAQAVAAGAKGVMPPRDMFWGDRYGQVEDPYGHVWAIATHIQDLTPAQMRKAMAQPQPTA